MTAAAHGGTQIGPQAPLVYIVGGAPFGAHRETGFQGGAGSRSNRFQKQIAASTANLCHPTVPTSCIVGG